MKSITNSLPKARFSETNHQIGRSKLQIKTFVAMLLCLLILSNIAKAQDEEDNTPIKVDTLLFTIPLTVTNKKGIYITGLKKEDFTIYENGLNQNIELFLSDEAPMNVAILLDTSVSTKEVLGKIQKAAREFIKVLRPGDRAIIVGFDNRTVFLSRLESDGKILSNAIEKVRVTNESGSDMYASVKSITDNYFAAIKGRKAIIALTDGIVTGNGITAQQTIETMQKSDIFFYPIIFKTDANSKKGNKTPVLVEILQIMAEESGGKFYEKDSTKLKEAFQSIAGDLKTQYLIGFYPRNAVSGNTRNAVRVTVEQKDFNVRIKKRLSY
jgi:Ca-activated chloride channel homolog